MVTIYHLRSPDDNGSVPRTDTEVAPYIFNQPDMIYNKCIAKQNPSNISAQCSSGAVIRLWILKSDVTYVRVSSKGIARGFAQ